MGFRVSVLYEGSLLYTGGISTEAPFEGVCINAQAVNIGVVQLKFSLSINGVHNAIF